MSDTVLEARGLRAAVVRLGGRIWAIPAAHVLKVLPHQAIRPSPGLAAAVLGVVAYAGEVLPVLDLRAMLKLEQSRDAGELLLVEIAGERYTVPVDQVLQILSADEDEIWWRGERAETIELSDLLAKTLSVRVVSSAKPAQAAQTPDEPANDIPFLPAWHEIRAAAAASLVVDTENSRERLPLYSVVELCETLPLVAIPDPGPLFRRAAFYRDALIPVAPLDALLGYATTGAGERDGAFIVVDIVGRRCVLSVTRVVGMSNEPAAIADLRGLLLDHLPDSEPEVAAQSASRKSVAIEAENRFLLVETAGRVCGFALDCVAHIHPAGRVAPTPPLPHAQKIAVTAVGGRVVPVLDLARELDLGETAQPQHFIEFRSAEAFVIAVDRVRGIAAIERKSLLPPPQGSKISAIVKNDPEAPMMWIIDPASLLTTTHGSSNAA